VDDLLKIRTFAVRKDDKEIEETILKKLSEGISANMPYSLPEAPLVINEE